MIKKNFLFLSIFIIVGFISLQISFTKLAGSNVSFTLFDLFGPIAGAFLGPIGVISVFAVLLGNLLINLGFNPDFSLSIGAFIRLFPMLFAVWYFGAMSRKRDWRGRNRLILVVPVLAIIIFVAHPIGRTVWYYSLFWTIPLLAYLRRDILLVRSLGATFTAHAVGGAAWIWAFNLPAAVWQGLIPVVISERLIFALGISTSYLVMKYALSFLVAKKLLPPLDALKPSLS